MGARIYASRRPGNSKPAEFTALVGVKMSTVGTVCASVKSRRREVWAARVPKP